MRKRAGGPSGPLCFAGSFLVPGGDFVEAHAASSKGFPAFGNTLLPCADLRQVAAADSFEGSATLQRRPQFASGARCVRMCSASARSSAERRADRFGRDPRRQGTAGPRLVTRDPDEPARGQRHIVGCARGAWKPGDSMRQSGGRYDLRVDVATRAGAASRKVTPLTG
jgi:hypothetical protein